MIEFILILIFSLYALLGYTIFVNENEIKELKKRIQNLEEKLK